MQRILVLILMLMLSFSLVISLSGCDALSGIFNGSEDNDGNKDNTGEDGSENNDGSDTQGGSNDQSGSNGKDDETHTHTYTGIVTNPTCTEQGYTTYTCSCGDSYVDDYSSVIPHNYVDKVCTGCSAPQPSEGLKYTLSADKTYYTVSGIGTCTDTDIVIPAVYNDLPVNAIGDEAFSGCTNLTSVIIPDSVTTVGYSAFSGCNTEIFTEYEYGRYVGNTENPYLALMEITDKQLSSYNINTQTKIIANSVFYNCTAMESIIIPDSVITIAPYAFDSCEKLTNLRIGNNVITIGDSAFSGCTNLTSVIIPDSVITIGSYAFCGCTSLTSVTIPDSVTSIGSYAFSGCNTEIFTEYEYGRYVGNAENPYLALMEITDKQRSSYNINNQTKIIADGVFSNYTVMESITIPDSVITIGEGVFSSCDSLTNITVDENNTAYKSIDGNLYSKDGKTLLRYAIGKSESAFIVPSGVTTIGTYAFSSCFNLTSVEISNSVTTIEKCAFFSCPNLANVIIGDSLTTIGAAAFQSCIKLTNLIIPNSVTTIEAMAFYQCYNLVIKDNGIHYVDKWVVGCDSNVTAAVLKDNTVGIANAAFSGCTSLTSVVIPDSVTSIDGYAFSSCSNLTSVVIGDGVTSIGEAAFYGCYSLTSVYYKGTATEWGEISIGSYNNDLTSATRYYYSETEPIEEGNFWHYDENGNVVVWGV